VHEQPDQHLAARRHQHGIDGHNDSAGAACGAAHQATQCINDT
jgi:hypothetical protein